MPVCTRFFANGRPRPLAELGRPVAASRVSACARGRDGQCVGPALVWLLLRDFSSSAMPFARVSRSDLPHPLMPLRLSANAHSCPELPGWKRPSYAVSNGDTTGQATAPALGDAAAVHELIDELLAVTRGGAAGGGRRRGEQSARPGPGAPASAGPPCHPVDGYHDEGRSRVRRSATRR